MDPKLVFWGGALGLMAAMLAVAGVGFVRIRRGDLAGHRRAMNLAVALVFAFVAAYVAKVLALGKESLDLWSRMDVAILRFHETVVALMVLAGGFARGLAWRFGTALGEDPRWGPRHRLAGRIALVSGGLALATAVMIFAGMVRRGSLG